MPCAVTNMEVQRQLVHYQLDSIGSSTEVLGSLKLLQNKGLFEEGVTEVGRLDGGAHQERMYMLPRIFISKIPPPPPAPPPKLIY